MLQQNMPVTSCKKKKKTQENYECQFSMELEKHNFGPILAPFGPKTLKSDFPKKKHRHQLQDFKTWSCQKTSKETFSQKRCFCQF